MSTYLASYRLIRTIVAVKWWPGRKNVQNRLTITKVTVSVKWYTRAISQGRQADLSGSIRSLRTFLKVRRLRVRPFIPFSQSLARRSRPDWWRITTLLAVCKSVSRHSPFTTWVDPDKSMLPTLTIDLMSANSILWRRGRSPTNGLKPSTISFLSTISESNWR